MAEDEARGAAESDDAQRPSPVWTLTANVVRHRRYGEGGQHLRPGTKSFRGGAKVHVPDGYPGMGFEHVIAVGHGRHTGRYITIATALRNLHNFRAALVYSPTVLRLVQETSGLLIWANDRNEAEVRAANLEALARRYREEHWAGVEHPPGCLCVDCEESAGVRDEAGD